jgi:glycosyltransferase involved in cell wall biosynthesis
MSLQNISAVIITRNASETLGRTLESLRKFSEVVIYDNGSEDSTLELARSFDNVAVFEGEFLGFGNTKSHAVSLARNDWVFSIDADESVTGTLRDSLDELPLNDSSIAFLVERRNFMMGKQVRHSGWNNDWLLRLFHRGINNFNDAPVHEKVVLNKGSRTKKLRGALDHDAVQDIGQFLVKVNRYSEIRRNSATGTIPVFMILLKAWFSFIRCYLFELGFLDGWRGLVIAYSNANGTFFKYMKPLADRKIKKERE